MHYLEKSRKKFTSVKNAEYPEMKRICIVCPTNFGGHFTHALNIAMTLERRGHSVFVLTRKSLPVNERPTPNGIEVVTLFKNQAKIRLPLVRLLMAGFNLLIDNYRLLRHIKRHECDTLVLEQHYFFVLAIIEVKCIGLIHNRSEPKIGKFSNLRSLAITFLQKRVIRQYDKQIYHFAMEPQLKNSFFLTLPTIGPYEEFLLEHDSHITSKQLHDISNYVLLAGELRREKGISEFIKYYDCEFTLVVVGPAVDESYLEEIQNVIHASSTGKVVLFPKSVTETELHSLIKGSIMVVLPYVSFNASSGIGATCMNYGVKVIASDLPSLRNQFLNYPNVSFVSACEWSLFSPTITNFAETARISPSDMRGSHERWSDVCEQIEST